MNSYVDAPFINVLDKPTIDMCSYILSNPFTYFINENNAVYKNKACLENEGLEVCINLLMSLQKQINEATNYPSANQIVNNRFLKATVETRSLKYKIKFLGKLDIKNKLLLFNLKSSLNSNLAERVHESYKFKKNGFLSANDIERFSKLVISSIWLSEHIALVILGIAKIRTENKSKKITFEIKNENIRSHLRRCWFGVCFDELSLRAASFKLSMLADATFNPNKYNESVGNMFNDAMTIFSQHWRLPQDSGPISALTETALKPLMNLFVYCLHAEQSGTDVTVGDIERLGLSEIYQIIKYINSDNTSSLDRVLIERNGKIQLSNRKLPHSIIMAAEELARHKLEGWHNNLEEHQIHRIRRRLHRNSNIEFFDVELRNNNTTNKSSIDVDFFIKHKYCNKIYAVQLKHLESSFKCNLNDWLSYFRKIDGKLAKGIKQLENLKFLISNDLKVKQYLIDQLKISESQLFSIEPIILHNIGSLDFWIVNGGIVMYDINTFCNTINGLEKVSISTNNKNIAHGVESIDPELVPPLDNPDLIIKSYTTGSDRLSKSLKFFDYGATAKRSIKIGGTHINAIGLGI